MDNIRMMVLALFVPQTSEFPSWLFEKKEKEKDGFEERLF